MDEEIRAFIAVQLPDEVRESIGRATSRLQGALPRARWVRPATLHLTVKFLGELPRSRVTALCDDAAVQAAGHGASEVRLAGGGFFPSSRRPRVAWIGGQAAALVPVADAVQEVAARHGVERERRPWSPHLTLARLRDRWPPRAVEGFIAEIDALGAFEFRCRELVVFSSRLEPGGAVHTPIRRLSLE
jgi:2'-5' RNA ligase